MLRVGDILGNLRVRISDPWEESTHRKSFEILLWFETSKNDSSKGGWLGCKCPCSEVTVPFYFPKIKTALFPELSFYFRVLFSYFPE